MMTNSRPVLRSWLVLIALALNLPACSRQPESTAKPAKPAEAQIQAYRAIGGRQVIAIISTNELELREGGENLVCTYTQQGNKLRVIVNVMGTTTAKYFDVTPMGLVDEGGNVFYEPETFEKVTAQIRLNTGLMEAVKQNNAAGIDRFVIEGANVEARDDRGTALVVAVQKCATRAVEALLKNGADPNQKNDDGLTPLMMAVSLGNNWERARKQELDNIASLLCSNGADLDLSDQMGNTALILSIINNRLEAGRILVAAGADRAIKNHEGHDAIFYAGDDGEKQDVIRPFVGILDGAAVPAAEYRAAYNRTYLARALQLGRKVDSTPESESRMRELSWMRLATLREAANLGIGATDEELKDAIQSNFAETNGVSSSDRYNAFIATTIKPLGFSAVEYEQHLRDEITIEKLRGRIGRLAHVTPLEIQGVVETMLDRFTVEYVVVRGADVDKNALTDKATEVHEIAMAGVSAGQPFRQMMEAAGMEVQTVTSLTGLSGTSSKELAVQVLVKSIVAHNQGEVTDPLPCQNDYVVAYVAKRISIDPDTAEKYRAEVCSAIRNRRAISLFQDWQADLVSPDRLIDYQSLSDVNLTPIHQSSSSTKSDDSDETPSERMANALSLAIAAAELYSNYDYGEALSAYRSVVELYPETMIAPYAQVGVAATHEAMKQYYEAADSYLFFATANSRHALQPLAVMGAARCREQLGQFVEARDLYEEFIAAHSENIWLQQVESGLLFLNKAIRASSINSSDYEQSEVKSTEKEEE